MVHVSHAYKNMGMARERISLILELMAMFLSFQMTFSLVTAPVVLTVLKSTSGLDPSSDTIAPRYLKLRTVSSFLLSMVMSVLMPLVLFFLHKPFVWCSDSRVALSGVPGLRLLHVPLLHYCVHGNTFSWYPLFSQSFAMGVTEYLAV